LRFDPIAPDNGRSVITYTHDANGNITADGLYSYSFNANNQLITVQNGSVRGEYIYNAKGQRVKKVAAGKTTIYHYDLEGNLIAETAANGGLIAGYVYAGSNRIAMIDGSENIFYYHNDHLGTPLAMTDAAGKVVWKAAYDSFGEAQVDPSSTVTNNFRFPGQYYDEESGLHYNWHRYYDPRTGRYVTSDPLGFESRDLNLYDYVWSDPINWLDISGLDATSWFGDGRALADGPKNGNWCGGNWSGGWNPRWHNGIEGPFPPVDSMDECCQAHDGCYGKCTCKDNKYPCIKDCDKTLIGCLKKLPDDPSMWPHPPRQGTKEDSRKYRKRAIWYFE
jgi:RHS repeat-associated protein